MGSHVLDILRQGIWASLTGGWFYDPQQQVFCNTFHLYLWIILLTFPLTIYAITEPSVFIWTLYCGVIGILFTVIKVTNFRLHHIFDTGQSEEEKPSETGNSDGCTDKQGSKGEGDGGPESDYIEMSNLGMSSTSAEEKTVTVSHVNLQLESDRPGVHDALSANHASKASKPAPLAEVEGDDVTMGSGSAKVSKQQPNSSSDNEEEEDSPDVDDDVPRTITTTADIEVTPKASSDVDKVDDSASSTPYENNPLGAIAVENSKENGSHFKLPTGGKKAKNERTSDNESNSSNRDSETSAESKVAEEAKEVVSEDWKPKMRMRRDRRAVRRSKSSQEWNKPKQNPDRREKLSSQSLNMHASPRPRLPTLNHSTSSNSDWSDISFGEVEIPDGSSCTDEQDNQYLTLNAEGMMSSSVGDSSGSTLVATSSSQSQFGRPDSPVFMPLTLNKTKATTASAAAAARSSYSKKKDSSQPSPFVHGLWSHNQGDADTDSLTSGGDTTSHSTDTSSSVNLDPNIVCLKVKDLDLTTPSSPSAEDLDLLRSQGAIPKKVKGGGNGGGNDQNGNPKESTSPGSTDLSDPEEIRRRLIEILWDPQQHSEELRQLQQFVKMKKSKSNDPEVSFSTKDNATAGEKSSAVKLKVDDEGSEKSSHHLSTHEEERKSTTPTEFCALLPVNPQLIRPTNRRARRRRARPQHVQAEVLNRIVGEDGHLATSHDDTTDGAVHWFQDEQGNWMSYTFGENSTGAANNVPDVNMNANINTGSDSRKHFEHDRRG